MYDYGGVFYSAVIFSMITKLKVFHVHATNGKDFSPLQLVSKQAKVISYNVFILFLKLFFVSLLLDLFLPVKRKKKIPKEFNTE